MSDYLPEEVVLEILHRVPVKSLIRFRCVSKSWNSLITNPNFINSHLTQSLSLSPNSNKLIVRHCTSRPNTEHYKLFHDNNDSSFEQIQQLEFPLTTRRIHHFMLVGYVNGLFSFHEQDRFILWNPSVRKFITLPKPRINAKTHGHVSTHLALGFDPKTNDYKVVSLAFPCNNHRLPEIPMVEVYSLSEGSWRITNAGDSFPPWTSFNNYLVPEASLNGAVHFAAHDGKTFSPLVLSFDLGDEVFGVISVPKAAFSANDDVHTSVIGGLLSLLCHDARKDTVNKRCSIWVMREYGVVDSWTKLFTVDLNGEILRVLGMRKNGHILVHTNVPGDWELSSYDPESQQVKKLGICGRQNYFCVDNYMENLVLLDKPNDVVSRRGRKRKCRLTANEERVRMLQEVRCMLQKTIQHEERFRHLQASILHQETIPLPVQEAVQHQQETILQQHMEEMLKSGLEETDTVKSRLLVLIQQLSDQVSLASRSSPL
ncbi:putative F-box protein At3g10240 isoform X2 [Castanea sativa]|uniref:putative F-box protein At3g10240 isoform X2 n=1 Tax=Castanea sativa TaxID=21020 RepID=UPI003F64A26E